MVGLRHRFTTSGLDAVLRMLCQAGLQGTLLTFGGLHSVQKEQKDRAANLKAGFGGTFWSPCLQTVAKIRMLFVEVAWCNQFTRWWLFSRFAFHPPFEQRTALTLNCTSHHADVDTFRGFVVSCTSLRGSQTDMAKDDRLIDIIVLRTQLAVCLSGSLWDLRMGKHGRSTSAAVHQEQLLAAPICAATFLQLSEVK